MGFKLGPERALWEGELTQDYFGVGGIEHTENTDFGFLLYVGISHEIFL